MINPNKIFLKYFFYLSTENINTIYLANILTTIHIFCLKLREKGSILEFEIENNEKNNLVGIDIIIKKETNKLKKFLTEFFKSFDSPATVNDFQNKFDEFPIIQKYYNCLFIDSPTTYTNIKLEFITDFKIYECIGKYTSLMHFTNYIPHDNSIKDIFKQNTDTPNKTGLSQKISFLVDNFNAIPKNLNHLFKLLMISSESTPKYSDDLEKKLDKIIEETTTI
jgi:hypothetical protein